MPFSRDELRVIEAARNNWSGRFVDRIPKTVVRQILLAGVPAWFLNVMHQQGSRYVNQIVKQWTDYARDSASQLANSAIEGVQEFVSRGTKRYRDAQHNNESGQSGWKVQRTRNQDIVADQSHSTNNQNSADNMQAVRRNIAAPKWSSKGGRRGGKKINRKKRLKRKKIQRKKKITRRRKTNRMARIRYEPGPVGKLLINYPSASTNGYPFDVEADAFKASGYVETAQNKMNTLVYRIYTKGQVNVITNYGSTVNTTEFVGVFEPAPGEVLSNTVNGTQIGWNRNYVRARERFIFDSSSLKIFLSNANSTPVRVWVDIWKCKEFQTGGTNLASTGPLFDIYTAYKSQPFYSGDGGHTSITLKNLFTNPQFYPLKVKGRQSYTHKRRVQLYLDPGAETFVTHNLGKVVYDGKKVEDWEDSVTGTSVEAMNIPGVTFFVTLMVVGLSGKDSTSPYPTAYTAAQVNSKIEMMIKGHRENVLAYQPKQYLLDTPYPPVLATGTARVIEPNLTAYPA